MPIRFYDRQFITRDNIHKDGLVRFEDLVDDYLQSDKPQTLGLPSVMYCAEHVHLAPKYFGDLVKKETGKTAQEYIQLKLIDIAKEKILDTSKSVSEIAYDLDLSIRHILPDYLNRKPESHHEYRMLN